MKTEMSSAVVAQSIEAAREAKLRYVSDEEPGISRRKRGRSFAFFYSDGKEVRDAATLARIKSLVIPPAWTEVWICPIENGHIQATGRDARRRKQYRYHPRWREVRDAGKYEHLLAFGQALPRIRRRVATDLRRRGMNRDRVLATVVRLLETTLIRVGNNEYVRQNGSRGLTTLTNKHARVRGDQITFEFKGKSGKRHCIDVRDPRLAKLVRSCQDLPGQQLFEYKDDTGAIRDVTSQDVNDYLREIAGDEFSAKDFRTWAGTILAAVALREIGPHTSQSLAKGNITKAVKAVSQILGNTPAICRRCYVHPAVFDAYLAGLLIAQHGVEAIEAGGTIANLRKDEAAVMKLLRQRRQSALRAAR